MHVIYPVQGRYGGYLYAHPGLIAETQTICRPKSPGHYPVAQKFSQLMATDDGQREPGAAQGDFYWTVL